jgi:hypothetical protein
MAEVITGSSFFYRPEGEKEMARRLCSGVDVAFRVVLLPALLLTLIPLPTQATAARGQAWTFDCVDCPKQFGITERSLRLDAAGHPHVAYGGDHLYYAWYDVVDEAPAVGRGASLALDGSGQPHIAYRDDSDSTIRYARHDAQGWQIETADRGQGFDPDVAACLDLDPQGRPHIAYVDDYGQVLKHVYRDALGWHAETLAEAPGSGVEGASLAVDGAGLVHISYTQAGLKYAHQQGAGWQIETVPGGETAARATSLALDTAGRPHIAYAAAAQAGPGLEFTMRYAYRQATGWQVETIAPVADVDLRLYPSLALDGRSQAQVSYFDYTTNAYQSRKYARRGATGWQVETMADSVPYAGERSSLVIDQAGEAHIAYDAAYYHELHYTAHSPTGWQSELVDRSGNAGGGRSLVLDREGWPHVSYLDQAGATVDYAYRQGAGWHREVVDSMGVSSLPGATSLALDGDGRPHLAFTVVDCSTTCSGTLKYAYQDGSGWQVETVVDGPDFCSGGVLALDGDGGPHVAYYSDSGHDLALNYAYRTVAGWHAETVSEWHDPLPMPSGQPSLALDSQGQAHIAYSLYKSYEIEHLYQDVFGWHLEVVPSEDPVLSQVALALDANGWAHLSYAADLAHTTVVRYTYQDGSGWHSEVIAGAPYACALSLALDGAGWPHLSCGGSDQALYYVSQDASGWQVETVTGAGEAGRDVSLVLDGRGDPHIAYQLLEGDLQITHGHRHADLSASAKVGRAGIEPVVNSGQEPTAVVLTDPLPPLTTYVPGSLWANDGAVEAGQGITWTGTVGAFGHLTATFAVTVTSMLTQPAMIDNVATLTGDVLGPLTLPARNVVGGVPLYLPLVFR